MSSTIKDIKEITGLSLATISKYLNGGNVLPENRKKIEAAIKDLRYEVNETARGLATGKTKTIGIVVYSIESLFTGRIIRHIGKGLRKSGYGLLICDSDENIKVERENISFLISKKVDGIFLLPVSKSSESLKAIRGHEIPIIMLDRTFDDKELDFIKINNRESARKAVELLIKNNHKKIAVISSLDSICTGWERYEGYIDAMKNAELEINEDYIKCKSLSIEHGQKAMKELLLLQEPPTAVLLCNYEVTLGALMALNESSKKCPEDISLIGFDDLIMNHLLSPKIFTIVQLMKDIGESAVQSMLDRIHGKKEKNKIGIIFGTTLKNGNSIKTL